jgi:uncharacterized protein (TIGR03067 family)
VKPFLLAGLVVVLALAPCGRCDSPKTTAADAKAIQGTWLPETAELAGKPFPEEVTKSIRLVLGDGGKYTVTVGDRVDEGTTKIDPTKKPKTLDIVGTKGPNMGKTFLAIYELKGDTLRVCYDLSGKAHPDEFKSKPNTQLFLVTYHREKKK